MITVAAGDTLWDLTAALLGPDATNEDIAAAWPRLYRTNQAVIGPDPSLIIPGQQLVTPNLTQPGVHPQVQAPPDGADSDPTPTPAPSFAASRPPQRSPADRAPEPSTQARATPSSQPTAQGSPHAGSPSQNSSVAPPPADIADDQRDSDPLPLWQITGYGTLVATAILSALGVKRLLQQRRRRFGYRIRMPEPAGLRFERLARAHADPAIADFIDRALRTASRNAIQLRQQLPPLRLAEMSSKGLRLHLREAAEPIAPFVAVDDRQWLCPIDAQLLPPADCADAPAPYPALVTIGHRPPETIVMVDPSDI
ncbi:MAG: hypothetical protein L0Y54_24035, partial [Sporichthyaceae bacterium]|nr:hypothetical protein [Sporichthyaceae bacterium]